MANSIQFPLLGDAYRGNPTNPVDRDLRYFPQLQDSKKSAVAQEFDDVEQMLEKLGPKGSCTSHLGRCRVFSRPSVPSGIL